MDLGFPLPVWQVAILGVISFFVGILAGFVGLALGTMRLPALLLLNVPPATAAGVNILVSTVSAMVLAGPRVLHAIGGDYPTFRILRKMNARGIPAVAIYTQGAISLAFILTESFETILVFSGFTMGLNTLLATAGVFVLRRRGAPVPEGEADAGPSAGTRPGADPPYRTWGYPITPLVFLTVTGWTLTYILIERPLEAGLGLGLIAVGFAIYAFTRARDRALSRLR